MKVTISIQSFCFSVPGLTFGLMFGAILNIAIRHVLYTLTNNSNTYGLSIGALILAFAVGLVMPMVSNYFPIQKALGRNLRESLDLYHRSMG